MSETRPPLLEMRLPARAEAAAIARAAIDRLRLLAGHPDAAFDLRLLVSELIENAVRHGAEPEATVQLVVELAGTRLRVEIEDSGPGFTATQLKRPDHEQRSGRGLWLVTALAHRWGIDRKERTRVWFELDLAAPSRFGAVRRTCARSG